jgi:hypothetical protein
MKLIRDVPKERFCEHCGSPMGVMTYAAWVSNPICDFCGDITSIAKQYENGLPGGKY